MAEEDVQLTAKLSLDTSEAEKKLSDLGKDTKSTKSLKVELPKDTSVKLPEKATKSLDNLFDGPKGLSNLGKVLKGATSGINGVINSIQGVMGSFSGSKLMGVLSIVTAIVALFIKLMQGSDSWEAVTRSFSEFISTLRDDLAPIFATLADILVPLINSLSAVLSPLMEILSSLVSTALQPVILLARALEQLATLLEAIAQPFVEIINLVNELSSGSMNTLANLLDYISTVLQPVISFFNLLANAIVLVGNEIKNFITNITGGLITFDQFTTTTGQQTGGYTSSLDVWQTSSASSLSSASSALEDSAKSWSELGNRFTQLFEEFWDNLTTKVADFWEGVATLASQTWSQVAEWAKGVWDSIAQWGREMWQSVLDFFTNAFTIGGTGGQTGQGFGGGLFNETGRWGNGYQFGDIVGSVLDFGAGLVGKGWLWADGGTLGTGAQVWGMNEQGNPEFLFNAGGHDTVINKEILSDAMYQAMVKAQGATSPTRIEVSVKPGTPSGPKELVQMILPSLKFALK